MTVLMAKEGTDRHHNIVVVRLKRYNVLPTAIMGQSMRISGYPRGYHGIDVAVHGHSEKMNDKENPEISCRVIVGSV